MGSESLRAQILSASQFELKVEFGTCLATAKPDDHDLIMRAHDQ